MPQSILLQVGQCGNQVGSRFWTSALEEHAQYNTTGVFDDSMATLFRNVDHRGSTLPLHSQISNLRARGIMIDMEPAVVAGVQKTPYRELFEPHQRISSDSGCGNNWAVGYSHYGQMFGDEIMESVRKEAEFCDSLQSFLMCQSMGGGTGSGLGSFVVEQLADSFPDVLRFVSAVIPAADGEDDVVTSPYNSVLALAKLSEHADSILPVDNSALFAMERRAASVSSKNRRSRVAGSISDPKSKAYDFANDVIASTLLNLTSSVRFDGSMNVDLNEISTNLVPFPSMKYLTSSLAPLGQLADIGMESRNVDQMFADAFSRDCQLMTCSPANHTFMAAALICRGRVDVSDIRDCIEKYRKTLSFVSWNRDGWKTGICAYPPLRKSRSLLMLSNNSCIAAPLASINVRFRKLFRRRAHLHHYSDFLDVSDFIAASESLQATISQYANIDRK